MCGRSTVEARIAAPLRLGWALEMAEDSETEIEPLAVQRAEFNLVQAYRNAYKDQFTDQMRQSLNLRQQALDSLIDREVLNARARELGIEISDDEEPTPAPPSPSASMSTRAYAYDDDDDDEPRALASGAGGSFVQEI